MDQGLWEALWEKLFPDNSLFMKKQIDDMEWIASMELWSQCTDCSSSCPLATAVWVNRVTRAAKHPPCRLARRSINLPYNSLHRYLSEFSVFGSAIWSLLILDFLPILLVFCHISLFPLNLSTELLSRRTSANWYPFSIVLCFFCIQDH